MRYIIKLLKGIFKGKFLIKDLNINICSKILYQNVLKLKNWKTNVLLTIVHSIVCFPDESTVYVQM